MLDLSCDPLDERVLSKMDIDEALASVIESGAESVDSIDISGNVITPSVLRYMLNLLFCGPTAPRTIRHIKASSCGLVENTICVILEAIQMCAEEFAARDSAVSVLQSLDLSYNALTDADVTGICEALFRIRESYITTTGRGTWSPVEVLVIRGNAFANEGLQIALESKIGIRELDCSYAGYDRASLCSILCDALLVHPTLKKLYLGSTSEVVLTPEETRRVLTTAKGNVFDNQGIDVQFCSRRGAEFTSYNAISPSRAEEEICSKLLEGSAAAACAPMDDAEESVEVTVEEPQVLVPKGKFDEHDVPQASQSAAICALVDENRSLLQEIADARQRIEELEKKRLKKKKAKKTATVTSAPAASKVVEPAGRPVQRKPLGTTRANVSTSFKMTTSQTLVGGSAGPRTVRAGGFKVPAPDPYMIAVPEVRKQMF